MCQRSFCVERLIEPWPRQQVCFLRSFMKLISHFRSPWFSGKCHRTSPTGWNARMSFGRKCSHPDSNSLFLFCFAFQCFCHFILKDIDDSQDHCSSNGECEFENGNDKRFPFTTRAWEVIQLCPTFYGLRRCLLLRGKISCRFPRGKRSVFYLWWVFPGAFRWQYDHESRILMMIIMHVVPSP